MTSITRRLLAACALLLALLAPGCKKAESPVERGDKTQTLELGNLTEPTDLDPHVITSAQDFNIVFTLLEGLTTPDAKDLPDPRRGAKLGRFPGPHALHLPLAPERPVEQRRPRHRPGFPLRLPPHPHAALGSEYSYMLYVVKNAEAYNTGQLTDFSQVGFAAPDDLTLRVTLNAPTPYFLSLVAHHSWFPLHQKTVEQFGRISDRGTPWTRPGNYVGNGPFVLKKWLTNQVIGVEKSPTYWDAANVKLHAINFYPIESADTEERAFRAGQLHITATFPGDKVDVYRREHPEQLHTDPYLGTYFYRLNVTKPPLNDPRVRRALAMTIDRQGIIDSITRTGQQPPTASSRRAPPGTSPSPRSRTTSPPRKNSSPTPASPAARASRN